LQGILRTVAASALTFTLAPGGKWDPWRRLMTVASISFSTGYNNGGGEEDDVLNPSSGCRGGACFPKSKWASKKSPFSGSWRRRGAMGACRRSAQRDRHTPRHPVRLVLGGRKGRSPDHPNLLNQVRLPPVCCTSLSRWKRKACPICAAAVSMTRRWPVQGQACSQTADRSISGQPLGGRSVKA
jgi:hypothetical protein